MKLNDCEGLFIECETCGDRVKIAKNKGSCFKTDYSPEWLFDFLVLHGDCDIDKIKIKGEV